MCVILAFAGRKSLPHDDVFLKIFFVGQQKYPRCVE